MDDVLKSKVDSHFVFSMKYSLFHAYIRCSQDEGFSLDYRLCI